VGQEYLRLSGSGFLNTSRPGAARTRRLTRSLCTLRSYFFWGCLRGERWRPAKRLPLFAIQMEKGRRINRSSTLHQSHCGKSFNEPTHDLQSTHMSMQMPGVLRDLLSPEMIDMCYQKTQLKALFQKLRCLGSADCEDFLLPSSTMNGCRRGGCPVKRTLGMFLGGRLHGSPARKPACHHLYEATQAGGVVEAGSNRM